MENALFLATTAAAFSNGSSQPPLSPGLDRAGPGSCARQKRIRPLNPALCSELPEPSPLRLPKSSRSTAGPRL